MKRKRLLFGEQPKLISEDAPFAYVEAFKTLRTNFGFVTCRGEKQIVLVTSTLQNEGKSSVAINLAISLSQAGLRVLMIDGDMRNPSLHRYIHLQKKTQVGLSTLLAGNVTEEEAVMKSGLGFDIIPGGTIPPNPSELIGTKAMQELLLRMKERYDYVICDTPPVGIITDAAVLSPYCDGVLFVIRQKMASAMQIRKALGSLETVNARIFGTVLNRHGIAQRVKNAYTYYRSRKTE